MEIHMDNPPGILEVKSHGGMVNHLYLRADKIKWLVTNFDANKCPYPWGNCPMDCMECWIRYADARN